MAKKDKNAAVKDNSSSSLGIAEKFKQSPGLYIGSVVILVLVVVTFVGGDYLAGRGPGGGGDLTFGYYDKVPISYVPGNMLAQYQEQAVRFYQSQGVDMSNFYIGAQIWRQAYEMAVTHTAILQIMKRSGYSVPEKTVDRQVASLPQFQENGRFSSALYNQMTDSQRVSLWRQVQDELVRLNYYSDFFGLLIPSGEAEFIGNMASVMRNFDLVSMSIDDFPDSEYLAYAQANQDLFKTIHLSRITVSSSERDAKRILESIKNGTNTFEDAARAQSQDNFADRGGDMGSRYSFELDSEIPGSADRNVVFGLRRGELSDVIRIGDRWAFFRVEDELKSPVLSDSSVMDKVRSYLRSFERGRMEDWAIAQANEFISEAKISGFDNAANWRSLRKNSFGPLPINYAGVDLFSSIESFQMPDVDVQSLSHNENFWKIAFSTEINTPSEPFVQGNNVIVLFPVEQINTEEGMIADIASVYSSYWVNMIAEQSLPHYFIKNPRMNDLFWEIYFRYFMP